MHSRLRTRTALLFRFSALLAVIALAFYLGDVVKENDLLRDIISDFGYVGMFTLAVLSGFNLAVPIPAVVFIPLALAAGLSLAPVLALIVAGTTIADGIAYYVGKGGRHVLLLPDESPLARRLESFRTRFRALPLIVLFLFAALVPFPNEVIVVPLAFMGYRLVELVPPLLLGNAVFTVGFAAVFGFL